MGRLLFIVNPRAGKTQIKSRFLEIVDIFVKAGWEVEVHTTQAPLDAMKIAKKRGANVDMVVCSGGDGTLSETISGMMYLEHAPILGYIPSGSTNDFASSLKIPSQMLEAAANVIGGEPYSVDIGQFCREKFCVCGRIWYVYRGILYDSSRKKESFRSSGLYA